MNERLLALLYRSLDTELSPAEQQELQAGLAASETLRAERRRIVEMRRTLHHQAARRFKPFFSSRVMARVRETRAGEDDSVKALLWAFKRVAVGAAVALLLLMANSVLLQNNRSFEALLGLPESTLEDVWRLEMPIPEDDS